MASRNLLSLYQIELEALLWLLQEFDFRIEQAGLRNNPDLLAYLSWPDSNRSDEDLIDATISRSYADAAESLRITFLNVAQTSEPFPSALSSLAAKLPRDVRNVVLVIRHSAAGVPVQIARLIEQAGNRFGIINGGDGEHEDPVHALVILREIGNRFKFQGLKVALVGDFRSNGVARSLMYALDELGCMLALVGPPGLLTTSPTRREVVFVHDPAHIPFSCEVVLSTPIKDAIVKEQLVGGAQEYTKRFFIKNWGRKALSDETFVVSTVLEHSVAVLDPCSDLKHYDIACPLANLSQRRVIEARIASIRYCLEGSHTQDKT